MASWGATQAQSDFSAVLDKAETEGPQLVTRCNQKFYVLTEEQLEQHQLHPRDDDKTFVSAWDALQPSFDERYDIDFPRMKSVPRWVEFE